MRVEAIRRLFGRRETETRPEDLTPDEQMVLVIFDQSRSANTPEIFASMLEVRKKWGKAETFLHASETIGVVSRLEGYGFIEVDDGNKFAGDLGPFRKITKVGSIAVKQIKRQRLAYRQPVTVNVPLSS